MNISVWKKNQPFALLLSSLTQFGDYKKWSSETQPKNHDII